MLSILVVFAVLAGLSWGQGVLVDTTAGPVLGTQTDIGLSWKGIPFAAPPVGTLRFVDPIPPTPWTQPLSTKAYSSGCPQRCDLPTFTCPLSTSEDCLYLNVFAPHQANNTPVMVFIHGGRFEDGAAGVVLYDASILANFSNVVVVTINYRLASLGFLVVGDDVKGNFAMKDQLLALHWVQSNIAAFGGNPSQVTLFGQSAGAMSVGFHLVSEPSFGLYHQVIMESNPFALPIVTTQVAAERGAAFAVAANCTSGELSCLQALSVDQVLDAQAVAEDKIMVGNLLTAFAPWTYVVDGDLLMDSPLLMIQQGKINKVPVVLGDVGDEARMFTYSAITKPLIFEECNALIDGLFPAYASQLKELYPIPHNYSNDCRLQTNALASDYLFLCPNRNASLAFLEAGVPIYRYLFPHAVEEPNVWGPNYTFCDGYACHAVELPFVFDSANALNVSISADETVLTHAMMSYWGAYARTGSPNGNGLNVWTQQTAGAPNQMVLNVGTCGMQPDPRTTYCEFWDTAGYFFP